MDYKLIALDMDGTLLDSQNEISKRNIKALEEAARRGKYIALSTGRILKSALYYSKSLGVIDSIMACNGAIITLENNKDIIHEEFLELDISRNIMKLAEENNIYYHFYDKDTLYSKEIDGRPIEYYKSYKKRLMEQGIKFKILKEPLEILKDKELKIYKFSFIEDDEEKLSIFKEKLGKIQKINISSSWFNNIEAMSENVSKGNGIKYLCQALDIDISQVLAIGDNKNDISMFQICGLAIAMENGEEIAKKYSHAITDTNNRDGVAKAIEKYIFKKDIIGI